MLRGVDHPPCQATTSSAIASTAASATTTGLAARATGTHERARGRRAAALVRAVVRVVLGIRFPGAPLVRLAGLRAKGRAPLRRADRDPALRRRPARAPP